MRHRINNMLPHITFQYLTFMNISICVTCFKSHKTHTFSDKRTNKKSMTFSIHVHELLKSMSVKL